MEVKILEVKTGELKSARIRAAASKNLPSLHDEWNFDFRKVSRPKGNQAFTLTLRESPEIIQGCMIYSIHEFYGPYMEYLEVAPHNFGRKGKYARVAGALIAYACSLSLENENDAFRGFLNFKVDGKTSGIIAKLENVYYKKYGAVKTPYGHMEIDDDQSRVLTDRYLRN